MRWLRKRATCKAYDMTVQWSPLQNRNGAHVTFYNTTLTLSALCFTLAHFLWVQKLNIPKHISEIFREARDLTLKLFYINSYINIHR